MTPAVLWAVCCTCGSQRARCILSQLGVLFGILDCLQVSFAVQNAHHFEIVELDGGRT